MKIVSLLGALACLAVAAPARAQDEAARKAAVEVAARVPLERASKGAPYSAETLIESSQLLADGNRISSKSTGRVYRDSEGRTRREADNKERTSIAIVDPVAGYSYSLDPVNRVAWRTPIGASAAIMGKIAASQGAVARTGEPVTTTAPDGTTSTNNRVTVAETAKAEIERIQTEQAKVEARRVGSADAPSSGGGRGGAVAGGGAGGFGGVLAPAGRGRGEALSAAPLEHKMIDGIPVEGRRTTTLIPAGQIGNEQPITITSEEWRSPDLNLLVQTRHSDPRTGESSYRLINIIRAEPDPSLFMVPPDYTVKDTGIRRMLEAARK